MNSKKERCSKLNWFLFMLGYFTAGYLVINWVSSRRITFYDVSFWFEEKIPFIPIFIFGYILVYLSIVLVYVTIKDIGDWRRTIVSFLLVTSLAYIIFLLFPVQMTMRPDLTGFGGISYTVTRYYYIIDLPYNCFPSLHVIYPALAILISWRHYHTMRWIFVVMALIVAASVVLVKQHYLADVVAGFVNAVLCFWFTTATERYWARWFEGGG